MPDAFIDHHALGLTWTLDEMMGRSSHALVEDGRVWLVDPTDEPAAMDAVAGLGEIAGVIVLLDRHGRDGATIASRLGVPVLRLPEVLPDSRIQALPVLNVPGWHERALWWPEHRALVVAETVGTGIMFTGTSDPGDEAGIHPVLRLLPPSALFDFMPEHLLVGHGRAIHGPAAATALHGAYRRTRRDIPRLLRRGLPKLVGNH